MPAPSRVIEDDPRGIFGPVYTFDKWVKAKDEEKQQQQDEKARKLGEKFAGVAGGRPAHWPPDTDLDPDNWVFWLPDGWGQGVKSTNTGKPLKCFIGPPGSDKKTEFGKRFFHKTAMEKFLGYTFATEKPKTEEEKEITVKSCHDCVPNWPGEDDSKAAAAQWLPRDWSICYRQLPTSLHTVFLPPGETDAFLWHRACVEQWLEGNKKNLAQMGNSKKMVERMADSMEKGNSTRGDRKAKMRKRSEAQSATVTDESYARCPRLAACAVGVLTEAGCPAEEGEALKSRTNILRELLEKRGFEDVDFMVVFLRASAEGGAEDEGGEAGAGARPYGKLLDRMPGIFYALPPGAAGERRYSQVLEGPATKAGLVCTGVYLFWSPSRSAWKLSCSLDDSRAGYAYFACEKDDRSTPLIASDATAWRVLRQDFFGPPSEPAAVA